MTEDYGKSELEKAVGWHPHCETARLLLENFHHFGALRGVERLEPTFLINGKIYEYNLPYLKKQEILFNAGQKANHVLQINGDVYGHSLLILLLSNPNLEITVYVEEEKPTIECKNINYLNYWFKNRIHLYKGKFFENLEDWSEVAFDLIHLHGEFEDESLFYSQFIACRSLTPKDTNIIFNGVEKIREWMNDWIKNGHLEFLNMEDNVMLMRSLG